MYATECLGRHGCFLTVFYTLVVQCLRDSLHLIPISIRRLMLANSSFLPLKISRVLMYLATAPTEKESKWIQKVAEDTWKGVWIAPNINSLQQAEEMALINDLIILYIHGGGFSMGHSTMFMPMFQLMINQLFKEHSIKSSILSLDYSLSPEHVWPKACYESVDAYRYLIHKLGVSPSKVVLVGDSAGGNLVASTLLILRDQRSHDVLKYLPPLPSPAGAALLSPWVDLAPVYKEPKKDTLSPRQLSEFKCNYLGDETNLVDPLVSPLHGDFHKTCPLFISYGENEILKPSIEGFILNLKRDGCDLTILKGAKESHIWLVYSLMATSKQVYERDCKTFVNWIVSRTAK